HVLRCPAIHLAAAHAPGRADRHDRTGRTCVRPDRPSPGPPVNGENAIEQTSACRNYVRDPATAVPTMLPPFDNVRSGRRSDLYAWQQQAPAARHQPRHSREPRADRFRHGQRRRQPRRDPPAHHVVVERDPSPRAAGDLPKRHRRQQPPDTTARRTTRSPAPDTPASPARVPPPPRGTPTTSTPC